MTAYVLFYFKHSENDSDERGEEKKKTGRHVRERKQGNKKKERALKSGIPKDQNHSNGKKLFFPHRLVKKLIISGKQVFFFIHLLNSSASSLALTLSPH